MLKIKEDLKKITKTLSERNTCLEISMLHYNRRENEFCFGNHNIEDAYVNYTR